MDAETLARLFGEPTTFAPEAVWASHEDSGEWPTWTEAVAAITGFADCDETEAEERLFAAILEDDVRVRLDADDAWTIELGEDTADRISRRYLDLTLERKENS